MVPRIDFDRTCSVGTCSGHLRNINISQFCIILLMQKIL
jgi:hypothetical protein